MISSYFTFKTFVKHNGNATKDLKSLDILRSSGYQNLCHESLSSSTEKDPIKVAQTDGAC